MSATGQADREDTCELCGLSLSRGRIENDDGEVFCCTGCRDVYAALDCVAGVDETSIRAEVAAEDSDDAVTGDPPDGYDRTYFRVGGMHCTTCETFVESVATTTGGIDGAEASYVTETVRIDYDPDRLAEDDLEETLSTAGYTASRRDDALAETNPEELTLWRLAAGVMLGMMVMLPYVFYIYPVHFGLFPEWMLESARDLLESARYFYYVLFLFATLVLTVTGRPILRGAYVSLKARSPNMDLLVALAAVSAYLYSTVAVLLGRIDVYYDVTVAIVVVVTAGTYYESRIKRKATDLLSELGTATVDEATLYHEDSTTETISINDLNEEDRVLVGTGERVPVDGVVDEGEGTVDEAVVTGESIPVGKAPGDDVVGGSVLVEGSIVVEVGEGAESSVDRVTDLMWNLQSATHGIQKLADRLAAVFVPTVVTLATVAFVGYLALGSGVTEALLIALTLLLVSCPCALGLATPLAVASGIREAIDKGIVVFDDTVFERLRSVDVIVFDKTGTLTTGDLRVRSAKAPDELLRAAVALERRSPHPIADAIVDAFGPPDGDGQAHDSVRSDGGVTEDVADRSDGDPVVPEVTEFRNQQRGIEGVVGGSRVLVGHPDLFTDREVPIPDRIAARASRARAAGYLPILVGDADEARGVVVLSDEPREGWEQAVTALSERVEDVVLLTGDDDRAAEVFRDHPGVDEVFAGVPPEGKAETIARLGTDHKVAMVGDGTNDGPALARADLGIALGGGTALAVDAADLAIVDDDLSSIETAFDLSTAAGRRVKQNIGWAFLYNGIAIPVAVLGYLNPLFAAVAMAASSLLVVTNSTRGLLD
jgi:Cu2+-exporting ATPase